MRTAREIGEEGTGSVALLMVPEGGYGWREWKRKVRREREEERKLLCTRVDLTRR